MALLFCIPICFALLPILIPIASPHQLANSTTATGSDIGTIQLQPPEPIKNHTIRCRGAFLCKRTPYSPTKVRLFSNLKYVDEKPKIGHLLDGTEVDEDGTFELFGEGPDDYEGFEPALAIYHQCGQLRRKNATYRRFIIKVPLSYLDSNETFDIGKLNIDLFFPGQSEGNKFEHNPKPLKVLGTLLCKMNSKAAKIVRLFATDRRDSENLISEVKLEDNSFILDSGRSKLIKPLLVISHQCDLPQKKIDKEIYRHIPIKIPFYYYNYGRIGLKQFDIGKYNLEIIYPGEEQEKLENL